MRRRARAQERARSRETNVELWLPMSAEPSETVEPTLTTAAEPKAIGRVLLVEDEDFVRISTADLLSDCGYEVVEAASAEEALALLGRELRVDFLVTDHLMTGMTGVDFAHAVRERRPGNSGTHPLWIFRSRRNRARSTSAAQTLPTVGTISKPRRSSAQG